MGAQEENNDCLNLIVSRLDIILEHLDKLIERSKPIENQTIN